jgi:hypothetical protein
VCGTRCRDGEEKNGTFCGVEGALITVVMRVMMDANAAGCDWELLSDANRVRSAHPHRCALAWVPIHMPLAYWDCW